MTEDDVEWSTDPEHHWAHYWAHLCETANQSRAHHWAALWNGQSEQSATLLFMTLPNKVITDHLILGI